MPLGATSYNPGVGAPPAVQPDRLFSDDVLFPLEAGIRVQIGRRIDDQMAIEGSYFGLQQWSVGRTIFADPNGDTVLAYSPYLQAASLLPGGLNNYLSYSDSSRVNNAELNIRMNFEPSDPYHQFGWLWGVRYFNLSDKFTLSGSDLDFNDLENLNYGLHEQRSLWPAWPGNGRRLGPLHADDRGERHRPAGPNIASVKGNNSNFDSVTMGSLAGFEPFSSSTSGTDFSANFELSISRRLRMTDALWLRQGVSSLLHDGAGPGAAAAWDVGSEPRRDGGTRWAVDWFGSELVKTCGRMR